MFRLGYPFHGLVNVMQIFTAIGELWLQMRHHLHTVTGLIFFLLRSNDQVFITPDPWRILNEFEFITEVFLLVLKSNKGKGHIKVIFFIYSKIPVLSPPLGLSKVVLKTTLDRPKGGLFSMGDDRCIKWRKDFYRPVNKISRIGVVLILCGLNSRILLCMFTWPIMIDYHKELSDPYKRPSI